MYEQRNQSAVPNPAENERILLRCADALEDASSEYSEICTQAAEAEADYKLEYNTALLGMGAQKMTEKIRLAAAHLAAEKEFRRWKLAEASQRGKASYMSSLSTKIDSLRTVAANYRGMGGSTR